MDEAHGWQSSLNMLVAKWEEEIKTEETILQTRKYKATGSYTLAKHCEVHRSSHIKTQAAAMNVGYNYPIADD